MVFHTAEVRVSGKTKLSLTKLVTGGSLHESVFTGPGELGLAPTSLGDIIPLYLDGRTEWMVGNDAFLASTEYVQKDRVSQGMSTGFLSGEGFFIYRIRGEGIVWITSFGAIMERTIAPNEQFIVDNNHLVAWNCRYSMQLAGGGIMSSLKSGEGHVCQFTGPGKVYYQTRNAPALGSWLASFVPGR